MKNSRVFLKELEWKNIDKPIFWGYFKEDKVLRTKLFKQYIATKTKPNLTLYLNKHIPENHNGDKDDLIYNLMSDFYKDKLSREFYSHTIEETEIYNSLDLVFTCIEDFKKDAFKPEIFDRKHTKDLVKNIIRHLEDLQLPNSTNRILQNFIDDNKNRWIEVELIFRNENDFEKKYKISHQDAKKKYRRLKRWADNYLNEYLESIQNQAQRKPKTPTKVTLKDFFNDEVDADVIKKIQKEFKGYTGKRLAMLLHRLVDLKLINILPKSKTRGRIHFVTLLKNEDCNLSYVNRILSEDNKLKKHATDDPDYIDIKKKLS